MSTKSIYPTFIGDYSSLGAWNAATWGPGSNTNTWYYSTFRIGAPGFFGVINSVTIHTPCSNDSGAAYGCTRIISSGNIYDGSQFTIAPGGYVDHYTTYSTNPATGAPWTIPELADLQIGLGMISPTNSYSHPLCNSVRVDVDYTPTGTGIPETVTLCPTSNGTVQLSPSAGTNYQCVDESSPDDADYVRNNTQTTYQLDLYELTEATVSNVLYVSFSVRVVRSAPYVTANGKFKFAPYSHGVVYYLPESIINFDTPTTYTIVLGKNPSTGLAWTSHDISDLQAGQALYSLLSGYPVRCTWSQVAVAWGILPVAGMGSQIVGICG